MNSLHESGNKKWRGVINEYYSCVFKYASSRCGDKGSRSLQLAAHFYQRALYALWFKGKRDSCMFNLHNIKYESDAQFQQQYEQKQWLSDVHLLENEFEKRYEKEEQIFFFLTMDIS
jgi:hypothetical protein